MDSFVVISTHTRLQEHSAPLSVRNRTTTKFVWWSVRKNLLRADVVGTNIVGIMRMGQRIRQGQLLTSSLQNVRKGGSVIYGRAIIKIYPVRDEGIAPVGRRFVPEVLLLRRFAVLKKRLLKNRVFVTTSQV